MEMNMKTYLWLNHRFNNFLMRRFNPVFFARPMTKFLMKYYGDKEICGCEIGVYKGENALNMLHLLNIKQLYLVDPYGIYRDGLNNIINNAKVKDIAVDALQPYQDKTVFFFGASYEVVDKVPSNLDFIYIDTDHTYESTIQELELFFPKSRVIGGHDFWVQFPGVCRAVMDFADKYGLEIHHGANEKHIYVESMIDWWFINDK